MIAPLRQVTELTQNVSLRQNLTMALVMGLLFSALFSFIWSNLTGLAAVALWPLGFGAAFGITSFISNRQPGSIHWNLLFTAQLLGILGAILFLLASIS